MPGRKQWKYRSVNFQKDVKIGLNGNELEVTTSIALEDTDVPELEHKENQLPCGCEDGINLKCDWNCQCTLCHDPSVQIAHTVECVHDKVRDTESVLTCICPCHEKSRPNKTSI